MELSEAIAHVDGIRQGSEAVESKTDSMFASHKRNRPYLSLPPSKGEEKTLNSSSPPTLLTGSGCCEYEEREEPCWKERGNREDHESKVRNALDPIGFVPKSAAQSDCRAAKAQAPAAAYRSRKSFCDHDGNLRRKASGNL